MAVRVSSGSCFAEALAAGGQFVGRFGQGRGRSRDSGRALVHSPADPVINLLPSLHVVECVCGENAVVFILQYSN